MKSLLVGASGLVGNCLLDQMLSSESFDSITIWVRKLLKISHLKLIQVVVDFENLPIIPTESFDVVFCTLGTTIKKAGSQKSFFEVDHDAVFNVFSLAKTAQINKACLLTAMGANPSSSIFYNKVKGQVERSVTLLNFNSLGIFRPSMLLGVRTESRLGETAGKYFMKVFDFLIPKKYKAVQASKVASFMIEFAVSSKTGSVIYESDSFL